MCVIARPPKPSNDVACGASDFRLYYPRFGLAKLTRQHTSRRPKLEWQEHARSIAETSGKKDVAFSAQAFLSKVGTGRTLADHRTKQIIFSQGDAADSIFYIHKGKVKLSVVSDRGKEAVIAILGAGDFFGEGCLAGQIKRMSTATAISPASITRIDKAATIRVLHEEPDFTELFLQHMLSRSIRTEEDLVDQLFNSSEKRLARVLLLLANFGKEGKPETAIAKMSQQTLAEIVGTTRSRVSFFMNKFRKLGFVSYNGGLEVHSSLLNVVLHD
jgi:CRP-like cAMP-binding protein